jgi:methionyl-tRNA formyltransferase
MRLLMLATGPFAAPTFRQLYQTHHSVAALVTAPVRNPRGGQMVPASPVREVAHEHGAPIFAPEDINTPQSQQRLSAYESDLLVVCDYGQILSPSTLATARLGGINLHASLLPKYRGAAPINWAIYHGETETGVTVIHMTPKVDAGPCVAQAATQIGPDETAVEIEARLAETGARLVRQAIDSLEAGRLEALPQDPALASKARRLKKTDGQIDWSRPAQAIKNQIRALEPWPKTYTYWHRREGQPVRLILGPVKVIDAPRSEYLAPGDSPGASDAQTPGTVLEADADRLIVAAGSGALMLQGVQPAGKRMMSIDEFLRGYRVRPGDRFGPE